MKALDRKWVWIWGAVLLVILLILPFLFKNYRVFQFNLVLVYAIAILGLSIATMGALTGLPMFWPVPTAMLSAGAAAGGLALINSMGQMAGFLSPYIVGFVKDATGSTDIALYLLAAVIVGGSVLALRMTRTLKV